MEELAGKMILVLGLGRSGRSAAAYCAQRGGIVTAADERSASAIAPCPELKDLVDMRTGTGFPDPADFDLVVPSPGIPLEKYADRAHAIWGDIELAYRALEVPFVAVTGTNGKSTTTKLIEAMLCEAGIQAEAAGNIGTPVLELVDKRLDQVVLEVSSFQLDTIDSFRPAVAVLLNITPDHLDRHGSEEAYVDAKARIFANQRESEVLVANAADPRVCQLAERARSRVWTFHLSEPQEEGAWMEGEEVILQIDGARQRHPFHAEYLQGRHNRENALASILAAHAAGASVEACLAALAHFHGLPHRSEWVRSVNGVRYINDSKATNIGAAVSALRSFDTPVVWIAGGKDKGLDFAPLASACGRVRASILMGETAPLIDAALPVIVPRIRVPDMQIAVQEAARIAEPGDVVLLAPACASFDQFRNFEERGAAFRAAVEALGQGASAVEGTGTVGGRA